DAFSTMTREVVEAFLVVASPLIVAQRVPLARLALKHRLPGMFPFKENVEAGGPVQRKRGGGRFNELRRGPRRPLSARRRLRRQNSKGRQTSRLASRAGVQISAGH